MFVLISAEMFRSLIILSYLDAVRALFQAVDQNKNGLLDFTDLMATTTMINRFYGQFGGVSR